MELDDPTRAALDAGIKDVLRELEDSTSSETMGLMAQSRRSRLLAFRQGLHELLSRLPEYERKLLDLHLDLGASDAVAIGERIAKEIRQVIPRVTGGLAATFRGSDRAAARRDAMLFEADVGTHTAGVAGRVLVAVERHRRASPTIVRVMENRELPKSRTLTLSELLGHEEQPWLDWKREFPPGLLPGAKHPEREAHRGKLLKCNRPTDDVHPRSQ